MRFLRNWRWVLAAVLLTFCVRTALFSLSVRPTAVLGETVAITEVSTGVEYTARVDTGAAVSSIHVEPEDVVIEDESSKPNENVAKKIHLRLDNGEGEKAWVEARVEDYVEVRSANGAEHRYQVRLPLQCGEVQKFAVLNLKDRSDMTYRLLLGRDFLRDDFVVDVAHEGPQPLRL